MGASGTSQDSTRPYHLMRRIFEGFAAGDASVVDQVCSPGLVEHQFGLAGTGAQAHENLKAAIRDVHRAVPDLSYAIEDYAEQDGTIWVRVRVRGTATGPFFRAAQQQARRYHRVRPGTRQRRPDRRALGRARPFRPARPDRAARPAGRSMT